MADHPIQFSPPPEDAVGQFGEKGSIEGSEMSAPFEGIVEEIVREAIRLFNPVQDLEADRSRVIFCQNFPVLAISSSRVILFSIGG